MITKVNKKIIVLFIFIFIFSIYGCNTKNHMHEYQLKKDETNHYYECKCGDIKDKDEHNYIWIVDKEATIEEEGYKHQECNVCKYTQNENTKIEKNVHIHDYQMKNNQESHYYECECGDIKDKEDHNYIWIIDKEATIEEEGYRHQECEICKYIRNENTKIKKINKNKIVKPIEIYSFESEDEYKQFVLSDETNYLYIDDIKIKNEIIYPISIDYQLNYFENESKPCLVISFSINNEKIANFYDLDNEESKYSMSFLFVLKYCENINDIQYQFNKYNNDECIYNNVINIYNGDNIIGEIYYYDEFNIYHNRIIDFIDENLKYKTSIKKLNSGYLYINEVKKENEELEVTKIFYETYYDAEENNPYILISFSLYIKTLDNNITTAPNLRFHFILKYCENIEELQYKFDTYDDAKTIYEKVVYI